MKRLRMKKKHFSSKRDAEFLKELKCYELIFFTDFSAHLVKSYSYLNKDKEYRYYYYVFTY